VSGAVDNFRFFDLRLYPLADADSLFAEVKAEGTIKATGLLYQQDYLVLMRARAGKIVFLREYFDPVRAARALGVSL
jgi:ketosteroid isomerase-like protein